MGGARFPQLYDSQFLHHTKHLSDQDLAHRIGCTPGAVRHARHRFDVHLDKPWNRVEEETMAAFYGPYPARLVAQGLGRSRGSLLAHLDGHDNRKPRRPPKPTDGFWSEWREHIQTRWDHWLSAGLIACAADLVWRPPTRHFYGCRKCDHLHVCYPLRWFLEPRSGDATPRSGPLGRESTC